MCSSPAVQLALGQKLVKLLGDLGLAAAGLSMEFQSSGSIFYIMKQQRFFLLLKI